MRFCALEGRCLITLDLDFVDVLRFPPRTGAGTVVLRPPNTCRTRCSITTRTPGWKQRGDAVAALGGGLIAVHPDAEGKIVSS